MQSLIKVCFCFSLVILGWSCSPANVRITANPKRIGYHRNDVILITPSTEVSELENERLMQLATEHFKDKLPLHTINYWDALYKTKQHGLVLPSYNHWDTVSFASLKEKLGVNFILLSTLNSLKENDNEFNNPDYKRRVAIVSFQLLDLDTKTEVWHCTTKVSADPLKVSGQTKAHTINILSGSFSMSKAYKESLKRLTESLLMVQ